jgi:hypothetical protein
MMGFDLKTRDIQVFLWELSVSKVKTFDPLLKTCSGHLKTGFYVSPLSPNGVLLFFSLLDVQVQIKDLQVKRRERNLISCQYPVSLQTTWAHLSRLSSLTVEKIHRSSTIRERNPIPSNFAVSLAAVVSRPLETWKDFLKHFF